MNCKNEQSWNKSLVSALHYHFDEDEDNLESFHTSILLSPRIAVVWVRSEAAAESLVRLADFIITGPLCANFEKLREKSSSNFVEIIVGQSDQAPLSQRFDNVLQKVHPPRENQQRCNRSLSHQRRRPTPVTPILAIIALLNP